MNSEPRTGRREPRLAPPAGLVLGVSLAAVLLASVFWRLGCIGVGPDPDTDAYGHYIIARLMWDTPFNLNIHWVWLPFYHALLALPVRLGATLDHVRSANAVLAALPPLLLCWGLGHERGALQAPEASPTRAEPGYAPAVERALPLVAALLAALDPLTLQLGTTGQMEVLFCSLLLLLVSLLARQRLGWAAVVAMLLVLTRYEGWAVAAVVASVLLYRRVRAGVPLGWGGLACLLLPALCVLGWAALRRSGGGSWFSFLFDNQAFAERVLDRNPASQGALGPLGRYTLAVPYRVFGLAALFAPLGIARTWRRHGVWFVAPGLGIIGFLTLSSLTRSQLGLDRHFMAVVPFAATWITHGMAWCVELLGTALGRHGTGARSAPRASITFAILGGAVIAATALRFESSLAAWKEATRSALPEPRALARFLRTTPESSLILCTEASIEVLSGLDRRRFVRTHLETHTARRVAELANTRDVYLVDRARRLGASLHAGRLVHGAVDGPPDAFVVVHLPAGSRADGSGLAALP